MINLTKLNNTVILSAYVSFTNDYISINSFAKDNGITKEEAKSMIARGKILAMAGNTPVESRSHFLNNNPNIVTKKFPTMSKNNIKFFTKRHQARLLQEGTA